MEYKQAIVDADEGLNLRKLPEAASDRIQLIPDRTIINTYPRLEVLNDGGA